MLRLLTPLALLGVVACAAAADPAPESVAQDYVAPVEALELAGAPTALPAAAPAPVASYAAPAHAQPAASAPSRISCDIDVHRTRNGLRLEATAYGAERANDVVEYEFLVRKMDAAGSSDIVQAGEVSEPVLGEVELSLERGARYRAELTLRDSEGEVCATEISS